MRSLILVVSAFAIFAGLALVQGGPVISKETAEEWASKRNFGRQFVQYKANDLDGNIYYSCKKDDDYSPPKFVCYEQKCKTGLAFSDKKWGCTIVIGPIPSEAPITEVITADYYCYRTGNGPAGLYTQTYKKINLQNYYWYFNGAPVQFQCAPGTYFNDDQTVDPKYWCQCITCPPEIYQLCLTGSDLIFTKNFKNPALENGIFFDSQSVGLVPDPKGIRGTVGQFDGSSSNIEVAYFQNNDFNQFNLNISFYRDTAGNSGPQGIFYDGGKASPDSPPDVVQDLAPPAIYIISTGPSTLAAGIYIETEAGDRYQYSLSASELNVDDWNDVKLKFDGRSSPGVLQLSVNGVVTSVSTAKGSTVANKIAALFGQSFDLVSYSTPYYFQGLLDNIAFYRVAL